MVENFTDTLFRRKRMKDSGDTTCFDLISPPRFKKRTTFIKKIPAPPPRHSFHPSILFVAQTWPEQKKEVVNLSRGHISFRFFLLPLTPTCLEVGEDFIHKGKLVTLTDIFIRGRRGRKNSGDERNMR